MTMPKQALDSLRDFQEAGLEVEVVAKSKHYLVYYHGEIIYKFSQGTKQPHYAPARRQTIIRKLLARRPR